ncbi:hypothetical protein FRX31_020990 [Thalictrum thalictroides]|uniref:Uncharacterized protein n=1 Tax=Thalictrum thalictroides TaxID=46969 RepID=A0A7J6VYK7_THATH|nr:hypothetical protein FRX31_020990 [Thalictrum thalictroides]
MRQELEFHGFGIRDHRLSLVDPNPILSDQRMEQPKLNKVYDHMNSLNKWNLDSRVKTLLKDTGFDKLLEICGIIYR